MTPTRTTPLPRRITIRYDYVYADGKKIGWIELAEGRLHMYGEPYPLSSIAASARFYGAKAARKELRHMAMRALQTQLEVAEEYDGDLGTTSA